MTNLTAITAKFTKKQVKFIEAHMKSGGYTNKSEALRAIVQDALVSKGIKQKKEERNV